MKNTQLSHGVLIALLLAASVANAQDYPASNFQPKVIYSSEALVSPESSSPCEHNAQHSSKVEQTEIDAKYPAANFQPKVIYSNTDAKQGT